MVESYQAGGSHFPGTQTWGDRYNTINEKSPLLLALHKHLALLSLNYGLNSKYVIPLPFVTEETFLF